MTCVIGTFAGSEPGNIGCHIARATSPCRRLTPLRRRLILIASGVIPGGSSRSPGFDAAEAEELLVVDAEPVGEVAEGVQELRRRVRLVARGHRRMGREDRPLAHGPQRVLDRGAALDALGRELERRERRMALVQVDDGRLDPERVEHPGAADPEQAVLGEAHGAVALVEPARRPACDGVVLRQLGVEEQQRHAADVDPPDLEGDRLAGDLDRREQRRSVGRGDAGHRKVLRVVRRASTPAGGPRGRAAAGSSRAGRRGRCRSSAAPGRSPP